MSHQRTTSARTDGVLQSQQELVLTELGTASEPQPRPLAGELDLGRGEAWSGGDVGPRRSGGGEGDRARDRDWDVVVFLTDVLDNVLTLVVVTNLRNKSRITKYEDKVILSVKTFT